MRSLLVMVVAAILLSPSMVFAQGGVCTPFFDEAQFVQYCQSHGKLTKGIETFEEGTINPGGNGMRDARRPPGGGDVAPVPEPDFGQESLRDNGLCHGPGKESPPHDGRARTLPTRLQGPILLPAPAGFC